jgi:hypothetical protein
MFLTSLIISLISSAVCPFVKNTDNRMTIYGAWEKGEKWARFIVRPGKVV